MSANGLGSRSADAAIANIFAPTQWSFLLGRMLFEVHCGRGVVIISGYDVTVSNAEESTRVPSWRQQTKFSVWFEWIQPDAVVLELRISSKRANLAMIFTARDQNVDFNI
jgi:hypothetical protein